MSLLTKPCFPSLLQLVFFCMAAAQSTTIVLTSIIEAFASPRLKQQSILVPHFGSCPVTALIALPISLAMVIVWAVMRHEDWSWVLQVCGDTTTYQIYLPDLSDLAHVLICASPPRTYLESVSCSSSSARSGSAPSKCANGSKRSIRSTVSIPRICHLLLISFLSNRLVAHTM